MTSEAPPVADGPVPLGPPPSAYAQLAAALGRTGWISHGSVVRRTLRRRVAGRWVDKGPYYYWTCKSEGKTLCQALSEAQYKQLQQAIATQRQVRGTLDKMHALTLKTVLEKLPGVKSRKTL